ncbi:hypothetical protein SAMN04487895_101770 [Paenibacillus sophorae]|uniref:BppU N-terminal domain-containing protein n=1 Tax=Paenibacillus sophorae TaxID=1333845 RepID=A0A1H8H5X9_9BACL|nr:hypothetical protein [Paenibacillus sophorae]QWU14460.1 hypothetical protein KP014_21365 [Paenibacillus sophorae]SEN51791.1 hypothetical protein SAMN04487895_101770 [Paenibacillus sophorae]
MPDLITQLQYNDPLVIVARKGTTGDPFKERTDSLPIINGIITLWEIPSITERVTIAGMIEIDQEIFEQRKVIAENEFLVHYSTGVVQFHSSLEGTTKLCRYKGRGLIMYPASRIYAMISRNPDVVTTLQDYITEIEIKLAENTDLINRVESLLLETRLVIDESRLSTDNANTAAQAANNAADLALDAYNTTRLVFKNPVAREQDLHTTYPFPSVGWTVQTYTNGKRYRFDGNDWIEIDVFGSNLQAVNEFKDGLMTIADYLKLKSYPDSMKDRIISFSLPDAVQGVIENFIPFPFNGQLIEMTGYCEIAGEMVTEISLERSRNLLNWTEITSRRLRFQPNQHFDDKLVTFNNNTIESGDIFRINMNTQGLGIYNITINLKIRI